MAAAAVQAQGLRAETHLSVLSCPVQEACLQGNLIAICLEQLSDPHPLLRQWVAICLGRIWQNFDSARWCGVRDSAHEKLYSLLSDPIPEVSCPHVGGSKPDQGVGASCQCSPCCCGEVMLERFRGLPWLEHGLMSRNPRATWESHERDPGTSVQPCTDDLPVDQAGRPGSALCTLWGQALACSSLQPAHTAAPSRRGHRAVSHTAPVWPVGTGADYPDPTCLFVLWVSLNGPHEAPRPAVG